MGDAPDPHPAARLQAVVKRRGSALALDGLSLSFAAGEVVALLGPNGAGKSTTVAMITGRLRPDAGRAELFGADPTAPASRRRLGVMLQEAGMPRGLTVAEQIDLFRGYYPGPRPRAEVLALAGLTGLEGRFCTALSGGQQRRVQFAQAICGRPDLLVLDEPSAGLDLEGRRALWTAVRQEADRGAAVLLTTHHLEEAEALADRIVVIDRGRVIADAAPETLRQGVAHGALRCRTALGQAALKGLRGVVEVRREGALVHLLTCEPQATLRALLAGDPDVTDIALSSASLEDALNRLVDTSAPHGAAQKESAEGDRPQTPLPLEPARPAPRS